MQDTKLINMSVRFLISIFLLFFVFSACQTDEEAPTPNVGSGPSGSVNFVLSPLPYGQDSIQGVFTFISGASLSGPNGEVTLLADQLPRVYNLLDSGLVLGSQMLDTGRYTEFCVELVLDNPNVKQDDDDDDDGGSFRPVPPSFLVFSDNTFAPLTFCETTKRRTTLQVCRADTFRIEEGQELTLLLEVDLAQSIRAETVTVHTGDDDDDDNNGRRAADLVGYQLSDDYLTDNNQVSTNALLGARQQDDDDDGSNDDDDDDDGDRGGNNDSDDDDSGQGDDDDDDNGHQDDDDDGGALSTIIRYCFDPVFDLVLPQGTVEGQFRINRQNTYQVLVYEPGTYNFTETENGFPGALSSVVPDTRGNFNIALPPGEYDLYLVTYDSRGKVRGTPKDALSIPVAANKVTTVNF